MAVQFSAISNLWTDATWQTVDTTSYLKSEAATTNSTTSYVASQTFTPGAITVEGILLRVKGTTATPTGTFSVELYNSTGAADGAWETLSYTLPVAVTDNVGMEFYVDCDGTTGWVNVDTFVSNSNNSMTYYMNGEPIQDIPSAGTTETFYTFII